MDEFFNKTILITGTSKGIGRALVEYFADHGAKILAISHSQNPEWNRENIIDINLDIKEINKLIKKLEKYDVDILINNAGVMLYKSLLEVDEDDIDYIFDINFKYTLLLSQHIAKKMINKNIKGKIVNTISFASIIPSAGSGIYAASKSALLNVTKTLAAELAPYNIRVNGYSPGVIETSMTENVIKKNKSELVKNISVNSIGKAEQMADIVAFLCSEKSDYINGCNIDASGGKFIVQNLDSVWEENR